MQRTLNLSPNKIINNTQQTKKVKRKRSQLIQPKTRITSEDIQRHDDFIKA
jgi:hypothetical protein